MAIVFNNTTYPYGFLGTDDGTAKNSFSIDTSSTYSVSVTGTVNAPGDTVTLTYGADAPSGFAGTSITLTASQFDNTNQIEFTSTSLPVGETEPNTYRYVLSNTQLYGVAAATTANPRSRFTADANNTVGDYNVAAAPCFASGTRIRVLRDGLAADVAVEHLRVGDQAMTASGAVRRITWIGHREIDCGRYRCPADVNPVRIAAHAFGENRPARDLVVSPGHAIRVDILGEVLVPAAALVDGATIVQCAVPRVTYWHIELERHDILLAENLPTESYLEMGNRGFFADAATVALHARPDAPATHADFCRPYVDAGPLVDVVRARVASLASSRGLSRLVA